MAGENPRDGKDGSQEPHPVYLPNRRPGEVGIVWKPCDPAKAVEAAERGLAAREGIRATLAHHEENGGVTNYIQAEPGVKIFHQVDRVAGREAAVAARVEALFQAAQARGCNLKTLDASPPTQREVDESVIAAVTGVSFTPDSSSTLTNISSRTPGSRGRGYFHSTGR